MKEFNWEEFKDENNNIVVHCKTEEEANDFCNQMHKHGMKWNTGRTYLEGTNYNVFKTKTCYSGHGTYSSYVSYEKREGHTILEWSDYMQKEFTKADLKYGYMVVFRNGEKALYMPSMKGDSFDWCNALACLEVEHFNESLLYVNDGVDDQYDVTKVYGFSRYGFNTISLNGGDRELIWERKEVKKMTVDEMQQKLEELTGEKIEIEPSKKEMLGTIELYCGNRSCSNCIITTVCSGNFVKCPIKN